jgi:hypothetical protein
MEISALSHIVIIELRTIENIFYIIMSYNYDRLECESFTYISYRILHPDKHLLCSINNSTTFDASMFPVQTHSPKTEKKTFPLFSHCSCE